MTNEGASQTEPWIEKHGVQFAYGYDKGGKLKRELGVSGIPHAFLVDPSGTIVWEGHPASLKGATIEEALGGALTQPVYAWPKSAAAVKKALAKGDFAKAIAEADDLALEEPLGVEIAAALRGTVASRTDRVVAALDAGDVLGALEGAERLAGGLKGLPEEERIDAVLERIKKDKELKRTVKVQEKLRELGAVELRRKKDCDEVLGDLEDLLEDNQGTFVGRAIEALIASVRSTRGKLQN